MVTGQALHYVQDDASTRTANLIWHFFVIPKGDLRLFLLVHGSLHHLQIRFYVILTTIEYRDPSLRSG